MSSGPGRHATPRPRPATRCSTARGRSTAAPAGTGTSARMAQLAARGELKVGDDFVHESIIGSLFRGRIEATSKIGNHPGIVPSIEGLGPDHRLQHSLHRRPRPLRPRFPGGVRKALWPASCAAVPAPRFRNEGANIGSCATSTAVPGGLPARLRMPILAPCADTSPESSKSRAGRAAIELLPKLRPGVLGGLAGALMARLHRGIYTAAGRRS